MRNIDEEVYEDDWIQSLSDRDFSAWLLMIISVCDDQGRFELSPARMRTRMFRGHPIPDDEIKSVINNFTSDKKVFQYEVDGKQYCQVINWWKYQIQSSFMTKSRFPAPKGWIDRYCYTGKGRKPIKSLYWAEGFAGFVKPEQLPANPEPPANP